jgi:hypothetical protein
MRKPMFAATGMFAVSLILLVGCEPERVQIAAGPAGFAGRHVGYSWAGEAQGTAFADANAYIETILELDENAQIIDAHMRYWQTVDGFWTTRQSGNAYVSVNFAVEPTAATVPEYRPGTTMFTTYTASVMSLYAAAVSEDGIVAATLVEPLTRYRFEWKLAPDFDFDTPMSELTIGSGVTVPTVRTAGGAFIPVSSWDDLADEHILDLHEYSHVITDDGVFEGIDGSSSVREFLERMGVEFQDGRPAPMPPRYGYFGIGGWVGNYAAIEEYLIGRDARELRSLVDWSPERFALAINEQNQFGVDVPTGATASVQNSYDGIAGATVRMSRESTSYQRALVQAGIITEADVIIGRF